MDVNETLRLIREWTSDIKEVHEGGDAWVLADLINGLDEWLSKGGMLPDEWKPRSAVEAKQRGMI